MKKRTEADAIISKVCNEYRNSDLRADHPAIIAAFNTALEAKKGTVGGASLIAAERDRQISSEGWTAAHDESHDHCELAMAAITYAKMAAFQICDSEIPIVSDPAGWPWSFCWWKPSADPIRNLVKAGALIAAEIDRLRRVGPNSGPREMEALP